MSEQSKSAFEAWYDNDIDEPLPDDYTILGKRYLYMGWQASTAEANKRIESLDIKLETEKRNNDLFATLLDDKDKHIAALEGEVAELKGQVKIFQNIIIQQDKDDIEWKKQNTALQSHNNHLREASQALIDRWDTPKWKDAEHTGAFINALRNALSATPAESLQSHDDYVIKRWLCKIYPKSEG